MREMTNMELRKVQLGILDYMDDLCNKFGLKYWLDYGTLIGAVRHKGFIPWDDDIDIAMYREDYDKLIEICRTMQHDRYSLSCVETDSECMYPFGKMIDMNTELFELGDKGIRTGVYIDIFPYDGAPMDEMKRQKAFKRLNIYGHLRKYQLPMKDAPLSVKRILVLALRCIIRLLPKQYFTKKIVQNASFYAEPKSEYVCALTDPFSYGNWVVRKDLFKEQTKLEFEGKLYNAPKVYDEWLRIQYGDYMVIPPKEKQIRHDVKAFFKTVESDVSSSKGIR
jgi:LPS biosynthesis protein